MTLRGLYDYVMRAITKRNRMQGKDLPELNLDASPGIPSRRRQTSVGSMEELPPAARREASLSSIPELHSAAAINNPSQKYKSARSILSAENEQERHAVTYRERLGGYLHPRDMRRLVTPFSASNEPELMVRRHVMLLNFDPLRAIVLRDRLLVLVPDGADSILIALERSVRGGIDEMEKQMFGEVGGSSLHSESYNSATGKVENVPTSVLDGMEVLEEDAEGDSDERKDAEDEVAEEDQDLSLVSENGDNASNDSLEDFNIDSEWEEFEGKNWIEMTFELQSVDAVLSCVVKMLSEESLHLRKKIFLVMEEMRGDTSSAVPGDHVQEQLRILKDKVREMEGRVQGFVRAMNQILDDEEDMSLMNLSRLISHPERFIQPVPQEVLNEESDEPELILEVYLQQGLSEANALELLKGNIVNTEELVSLQMDTIRNRLLYINTVVSVISLTVASASLVGSIFGMNLTNHMESNPNTFVEVVTGTLIGMAVMLVVVLVLISKTGIMPVNPGKVLYSKRRVDVEVR